MAVRVDPRDAVRLKDLCGGDPPESVLKVYELWRYGWDHRLCASGAMNDVCLFTIAMLGDGIKKPVAEPSAFDYLDPNVVKSYVYVVNANYPPGQQVMSEGVFLRRDPETGLIEIDEYESGHIQHFPTDMVRVYKEPPRWAKMKAAEAERQEVQEQTEKIQTADTEAEREMLRQQFLASQLGQFWLSLPRGADLFHRQTSEPCILLEFDPATCLAAVLWPRRPVGKRESKETCMAIDPSESIHAKLHSEEEILSLTTGDKTIDPTFGWKYGLRVRALRVVGHITQREDRNGWFLRVDPATKKFWVRIETGPRKDRDRLVDSNMVVVLNTLDDIDVEGCKAAGPPVDENLQSEAG